MYKNGGLVIAFVFGLIVASIGLGAWLVAPSTQTYEQCNKTEGGNATAGKHQNDVRERRSDLAGVPGLMERLITNPEPCHGEDNEKRDLAAQEASAAWAFWIVFFSGLQLVVSGFGLWALLRTIHQGELGLVEARNAVSETSRVGEAQARAYLSVVKASFHVDRRPRTFPDFPTFELTLKFDNSGETPAVNVSYYCEARVATWSDSKAPPGLDTVPFQQFVTNKPPGQHDEARSLCSGVALRWIEYQGDWARTTKDTKFGQMPSLIICGVVFYEDVFGKTFRSQFGFMFTEQSTTDKDPVGHDDLSTIQACIPTFERIDDRSNYIKPLPA